MFRTQGETEEAIAEDESKNDCVRAAARESWYNRSKLAVDRTTNLGKGPSSAVYRCDRNGQDAIIKIVSLRDMGQVCFMSFFWRAFVVVNRWKQVKRTEAYSDRMY
jgi:hypothetical protein